MRFSSESPTRRSPRRRLAVGTLVVAGLFAAACSSSGSGSPTTSPSTLDVGTLAPEPTDAVTDGSTFDTTGDTAAPETIGTTASGAPVFPLTGLPAPDAAAASHPAMVVKVGNYDAHPQRGLSNADIVYEEIINANVSRFAAVFQSKTSKEVGPIRSGRRQDVNLFGSLNRPIFAWAGGNPTVSGEIRASDLIDFSQSKCQNTCYRSHDDTPSEFTLMFDVEKLYALSVPKAGAPPAQFQYRAAGDALPGSASIGVKLTMDNYKVDWTWNAATKQYDRAQNGRPDKGKAGDLLTTENIVVLEMVYIPGVSRSPDAQSVGTGKAWVFTAGNMVEGTWTRANRTAPFTLKDASGAIIKLTPGRTFIELPRKGNTTPK
jgi:hypothetical protein